MIPIYSFWSDCAPTDEELIWAINKANKELSIVQINWRMFGYPYCITVRYGMTLDECKEQIPKAYGV